MKTNFQFEKIDTLEKLAAEIQYANTFDTFHEETPKFIELLNKVTHGSKAMAEEMEHQYKQRMRFWNDNQRRS